MGQKLGLVIGNSAYRDSTLASLATPDVDVGDLADVLLEPEVGDFDNVQVFVNASSSTLRRAISKFFSLKNRDDLLLLYFSGHGVLDENGRLYLAVKDTERQLLRGTAIPASFISDEMNNSRSKRQVLILDCCHSGAFGRGAKGVPGASVGTATAFEGTGYGRVVLTATDETQFAWEGDRAIGEPVNSVFTHYIIQGLKTGEADSNGDGFITIDELYDYAYERVLQETQRQTPGKWSYKEQGEIVIAQSPGRKPIPEQASDPFRESDEEIQQWLSTLYTKGLSAYWLEEWDKAQYAFSSIVEVQPDYKDAAGKLDEVKRKEKLQALYRQAKQGIEDEDWKSSVEALETVLADDPDYKDAASLLRTAKKEKKMAALYSQARELAQAQQWEAVTRIFEQIKAEEPSYPDPEGLATKASQELEAIERLERLRLKYGRALQELDRGKWEEARQLLLEVREVDPDYEDSSRLLERIESKFTTQEEASRQRPEFSSLIAATADGLAKFATSLTSRVRIEGLQGLPTKRPGRPGSAPSVTTSPTGIEAVPIRERSRAEMKPALIVTGGWLVASVIFVLLYLLDPIYWLEPIDAALGYILGGYTFTMVISLIFGFITGTATWFALRGRSKEVTWKRGLVLVLTWMAGFTLASSISVILFENRFWLGWFVGGIAGGAFLGLATGRIFQPALKTARYSTLRSTIGGISGLTITILDASLIAVSPDNDFNIAMGHIFGGPLGPFLLFSLINIAAGLITGWSLFGQERPTSQIMIPWRSIFFSAAGFGLTAALLNTLNYSLGFLNFGDGSGFLYVFLVSLVGTAALAIPYMGFRRGLLVGILGAAGAGLMHGLWILSLDYEYWYVALLFWGIGIAAALGITARNMRLFWILLFVSIPISIFSFQVILPWLEQNFLGNLPLWWALYGGLLVLAFKFFAGGILEMPARSTVAQA